MASIKRCIARARADRRGLSAMEYALMASCGAMVLLVGYEALFNRLGAALTAVFP